MELQVSLEWKTLVWYSYLIIGFIDYKLSASHCTADYGLASLKCMLTCWVIVQWNGFHAILCSGITEYCSIVLLRWQWQIVFQAIKQLLSSSDYSRHVSVKTAALESGVSCRGMLHVCMFAKGSKITFCHHHGSESVQQIWHLQFGTRITLLS